MISILLDIDGVLVTVPPWRPVPTHADSFMEFDEQCCLNLQSLLNMAHPCTVVISSSHRIKFDRREWKELLVRRGINKDTMLKVEKTSEKTIGVRTRRQEIEQWVEENPLEKYLILDDDAELEDLPKEIKKFWVRTGQTTGLDLDKTQLARQIIWDQLYAKG